MVSGPTTAARTAGSGIDAATLIGLVGGLALVAAAMVMGGSLMAFLDIPSVLIVIGGTTFVTITCFSMQDLARSLPALPKAIVHVPRNPRHAAVRILQLAEIARRNGVLSLQGVVGTYRNDPLLHKGLLMVVDGLASDEIEALLIKEMQTAIGRDAKAANILRKAAEVAPAMGLIGTLIGLVQMLGNLSDPGRIGPAMAVALLTTFYGAILANMVLSPLAAKLDRNAIEDGVVDQLHILGVLSVARQENPRRLEMLLNSVLPPQQRLQYFD